MRLPRRLDHPLSLKRKPNHRRQRDRQRQPPHLEDCERLARISDLLVAALVYPNGRVPGPSTLERVECHVQSCYPHQENRSPQNNN